MYQTKTQQNYKLEPTPSTRREELGWKLKQILGSSNVWYQPPENTKFKYPCILYSLNRIRPTYADNGLYKADKQYTITVIDFDPDSPICDMVATLPMCSFDRRIVVGGLYHSTFTIYY